MKLRFDGDELADFCHRWNVVELAVFRSVARNEAEQESGINILVTFSADAHVGLFSLAYMEKELSAIFHREVDLVTKGGLKPLTRDEILAEAEALYVA